MRLVEDLRSKHPGMARQAARWPLKAIRLFCLECMGGQALAVTGCASALCPLHPFRFGKRPKSGPEDAVDTASEGSA